MKTIADSGRALGRGTGARPSNVWKVHWSQLACPSSPQVVRHERHAHVLRTGANPGVISTHDTSHSHGSRKAAHDPIPGAHRPIVVSTVVSSCQSLSATATIIAVVAAFRYPEQLVQALAAGKAGAAALVLPTRLEVTLLGMVGAVLLPALAQLSVIRGSNQPWAALHPTVYKLLNGAGLAFGLLALPIMVQAESLHGPFLAAFASITSLAVLTHAACLRSLRKEGNLAPKGGVAGWIRALTPRNATAAVYQLESFALAAIGTTMLSAAPLSPHPLLPDALTAVSILTSRMIGAGLLSAAVAAFALCKAAGIAVIPEERRGIPASGATPSSSGSSRSGSNSSGGGGVPRVPDASSSSRLDSARAAAAAAEDKTLPRRPPLGTDEGSAPARTVNGGLAAMAALIARSLTAGQGVFLQGPAATAILVVMAAVCVWSLGRIVAAPRPYSEDI